MIRQNTVIQMSVQRMVCTGCGSEANATCDCGVPYVPKAVRAREIREAEPERSIKSIAREVGTSPANVRAALGRGDNDPPPEPTGFIEGWRNETNRILGDDTLADDCDTNEDFWRRSLGNMAGDAVALTDHDAKKSVQIGSTLADALRGAPGCTIGCHLSNTTTRNAAKFPHAVLLAAATKNSMLIVDQFKDGKAFHAWRYVHRMGKLVDLNDTDKTKKVIKAMPRLAERMFTLYAPYKNPPRTVGGNTPGNVGNVIGPKSPRVIKGALARAVKAGLISAPVAKALSASAA